MQQTRIPTISIRANIWITIPIVALIAAVLTTNFLLLNYVHVFTSMLWTGTDIFMAFLLGPVLRNVSLSTRKEVIFWLMPKMIFYMPTISAVTTTAGYFLALRLGLISLHPPVAYWMFAVLVIVAAMFIHVLNYLLIQRSFLIAYIVAGSTCSICGGITKLYNSLNSELLLLYSLLTLMWQPCVLAG
jgi:hypothetical protein